ncbi:MAG TPA: methyltransferase domain-containing protein [Thermoanaerobaculia bacterium]|nr:methyltransferase domain-containing protein [Thermoanaerobaculia bacterium]
MINTIRRLYRATLPVSVRRGIRAILREMPARLHDAPRDLLDALGVVPPSAALPPAELRRAVGIDSSRAHFEAVGAAASAGLLEALAASGADAAEIHRWLDFGCGCGRVARLIAQREGVMSFTGVDIDEKALAWCAAHLAGEYAVISPQPPARFADASFDLIYSISVFTHFDETTQFEWLAELHRLLRPGGILIATTHAETLTYNRPDLTSAQHEALAARGFVFARGDGNFSDDTAFHTAVYLAREWSRWFTLLTHRPAGLAGYQDVSVWRR